MKKIEWDTVNGLEFVDEYHSETVILEKFDIEDLITATDDDPCYGAEITEEQVQELRDRGYIK